MLKFSKKKAHITGLNVREEKHGDEPVTAVDIDIQLEQPNTVLDLLAPKLRESLYGMHPDQTDIDDAVGHMATLKFPYLARMVWDEEMADAAFIIHGDKKEDNVGLTAKIKNISFVCKEGGTVVLKLRAQGRPTPEDIGRLSMFLGYDRPVTLTPPAAPESPPVE